MFPNISAVLSAIGATAANEQAKEHAQAQSFANPENQALIIKEAFAPAVLASITNKHLGTLATAEGFKVYCDQYLAACGNPSDPVEIMLLQQLQWSHHRIGQLLADAAAAKSPEMAEAYTTSACKLMAENRRSTLALHQYRAPVLAKQVTVVKNVAAGDQQIAVMQGDGSGRPASKKTDDTQLVANDGVPGHDEQPTAHTQAGRGASQRCEASGRNARRSATAA